jgi:metallo-beta-lactamase family protein
MNASATDPSVRSPATNFPMSSPSPITVTLLGAAGDVTGSAYLVDTGSARVLVDFGLFQGSRECEAQNVLPPQLEVARLDVVLLTHAHLDHTGRLPLLTKAGYAGPVLGTPATLELAELVLRDAAKVQAADLERRRRHQPASAPELEPLYLLEHVEAILALMRPVGYVEPVEVARGVRARFIEAGHMLGSTSIQLEIATPGGVRRIVFSGDLGPKGAPILRDYETFQHADLVFLESTYGDRDHRPFAETTRQFQEIMQRAISRRAKVLVPTFAIGRAQVMLTILASMFRAKQLPPVPIFLDSPMAIEATRIFREHPELFDEEMTALISEQPLEADLKTLTLSQSADDSRRINDAPGPCVVLAGSGMCNAGRILHHLRHNLASPDTAVVIVGYQGHGTLGRRLVDREREVRIFGEFIPVRAQVHTLGGFSAHAGQTELLKWFAAVAPSRPKVVLTHGEDRGREPLATLIRERHGLEPILPLLGDVITV